VAGNLIREMDELGRITEYNHDDRGNLVRIRDAAAGIQRLSWNSADFLISHTDCSGRTTTFGYDKYGWLKEQTDAAGNRTLINNQLEVVNAVRFFSCEYPKLINEGTPHFAMDEVTYNYIFRGHKRHKYKVLLKFVDLRRRQLRAAGANQSSQARHRKRRRGVLVSQRCVRYAARADGRGR